MFRVLFIGYDCFWGTSHLDLGKDFCCYRLTDGGQKAVLRKIDQIAPDVVLMSSPFSSGTLAGLMKQDRSIPVIGLLESDVAAESPLDPNFDDIVFAPFTTKELAIRIKRILEKKNGSNGEVVRAGGLLITTTRREVSINSAPTKFNFREFELLRFLASHRGLVYTRKSLLREVWGINFSGSPRTVDVHVRRIRSKLQDPELIETLRGAGYRFKDV